MRPTAQGPDSSVGFVKQLLSGVEGVGDQPLARRHETNVLQAGEAQLRALRVVAAGIEHGRLQHGVANAVPLGACLDDVLKLIAPAWPFTEHRQALEVEALPVQAPTHGLVSRKRALVIVEEFLPIAPGDAPDPLRKDGESDRLYIPFVLLCQQDVEVTAQRGIFMRRSVGVESADADEERRDVLACMLLNMHDNARPCP
jgi:hypothetical protein